MNQAVLDGLYSFFLGAVMLVITITLRQAAAAVDAAQTQALGRYADAVRHNATEAERVQIDALVHDSVLTTLLSAARARTPESMALAARMARNAMGHLTSAQSSFPSPPSDVPLHVLAGRLRLAAAEQPLPFEVTARGLGGASVPDAVAEALVAAATQAMVNSVNHAGTESGIARSVSLSAAEGEVLVLVEDTGQGFDLAAIPVERLGIRTSIVQRISSAGGSANIVSRPGVGTRVELHWAAALVDAGAAPLGQDAEWVR